MANGDHDWTAAEVVTAANMDDYLQLQTVQKFATAAARDAALTTRKREGMVTYQDDVNTLTVYTGAAWSTIGPVHGALTVWTPVVTQSGNVTVTNTASTYIRTGRWIRGMFNLVCTGAGTAANLITVSLPVTAVGATALFRLGIGEIADVSAPVFQPTVIVLNSATTMKFEAHISGSATRSYHGVATIAGGLAVGDTLNGVFAYEAAADA